MRVLTAERSAAGCVDCGFTDLRALEFDHVRGVKDHNISEIVRLGLAMAVLQAEWEKCDVPCRNRHAIAKASRRTVNWFDRMDAAEKPPRRDSNPRPSG
jgi:hypothetical protein